MGANTGRGRTKKALMSCVKKDMCEIEGMKKCKKEWQSEVEKSDNLCRPLELG